MTKAATLLLLLLMLFALLDTAVCEKPDSADMIAKGKKSTALVEVGTKKSTGTAFCVDETGLFLTNAHVVRGIGKGKTVTLVLESCGDNQRILKAEVLLRDEESDLALLKVQENVNLPSLELGSSDDLAETMKIYSFGFPFGKSLSFDKGEFPAITVNMGRITSLRKKHGKLELIQIDADLNPGNSGGPVLDESGHVVGIVSSGVLGTNVNFAIPVAKASALS